MDLILKVEDHFLMGDRRHTGGGSRSWIARLIRATAFRAGLIKAGRRVGDRRVRRRIRLRDRIGLGVLFAVGLVLGAGAFFAHDYAVQLQDYGVMSTGTVVSTYYAGKSQFAEVTFTTVSGTTLAVEVSAYQGDGPVQAGDSMPILYDPADPDGTARDARTWTDATSWGLGVGAVIVLATALILWVRVGTVVIPEPVSASDDGTAQGAGASRSGAVGGADGVEAVIETADEDVTGGQHG
ncbi:DUF3592 domain-containing protein [Amycolatopsis sp. NPDC059021]|uniref:DUF3592 domain-containing protein n=1 Tax=Amycolatopsis sp. NPDC059021 TaxID=3346704 RepID=UPI00366FA007